MDTLQRTMRESAAMRWLMLLLVSMLMFSTYWFQDFFSGLKGLMESEMGFTSAEFGRMIGLTTIANIFGMIIIGGIILDKWGIRLAGFVFGGLATLGATIVALGAYGFFGEAHSTKLTMMIIGRIMFGSGLEVVCVVATRTVVKWFKGYELALAMAINMGFGRLGSAMGIALSIDIGGGSVPPAVAFAATLIGLSLIFFLVYSFFDIRIDRQTGDKAGAAEGDEFRFADLVKLITNRSFIFIALLCVTFYAAVFPFIQYAPDLMVNKFGFSYNLPEAGDYFTVFGSLSLGNAIIFIGLFIFGIAFSMVPAQIKTMGRKVLSMIIIFALFVLFISMLWGTLSIWLKNGPKTASLIPMGTILFTPIFGSYIDRKGKAASVMILGALLLIFAHLSLSLFNNVVLGYLGLVSLGIAFSLVPAAMWPSVAKIVAESRLGTAYATMFTIQNIGLLAFFWGIGKVLDLVNPEIVAKLESVRETLESQGLTSGEISDQINQMRIIGEIQPYNYTWPIFMLVVLGIISIFLAFQLRRADARQRYGLELPFGKRP